MTEAVCGRPTVVWLTSWIELVERSGESSLSCSKSSRVSSVSPGGAHIDYGALSAALENRFGNTRQVELNRTCICSRMKRKESLPELAEDIEQLTRLAYPGAAEEMITVLAKDQFRCSTRGGYAALDTAESASKSAASTGSHT